MRVSILETISGNTATNEIEIWGDNGSQCRPYVTQFPIGTEWMLAISRDHIPENPTYAISVCGAYWLKIENDRAFGRIDSEEDGQISQKELRQRLIIAHRGRVDLQEVLRNHDFETLSDSELRYLRPPPVPTAEDYWLFAAQIIAETAFIFVPSR